MWHLNFTKVAGYDNYTNEMSRRWKKNPLPFKHWFPEGQNRVYFPLNDQQHVQVDDNVQAVLTDVNCVITDYKGGYCQQGKRVFRIAKAIEQARRQAIQQLQQKHQSGELYNLQRELDSTNKWFDEVLVEFENSPHRVAKGERELVVVISQDPHDIAQMSTGRSWTSCMNLDGGAHSRSVYCEVESGGLVAYLIYKNDVEIRKPLARIHIRRFENRQGQNMAVPEQSVYGNNVPGFEGAVRNFINQKQQNSTPGFYKRKGGDYSDTFSGSMLIAPENSNEILKWLRGGSEDAVFSTWKVVDTRPDPNYNDDGTEIITDKSFDTKEEAERYANDLNAYDDDDWREVYGDEWLERDEETGEWTHQRHEVQEKPHDYRHAMMKQAIEMILKAPKGSYPNEVIDEVVELIKQNSSLTPFRGGYVRDNLWQLLTKTYPERVDNQKFKEVDRREWYKHVREMPPGPNRDNIYTDEVNEAMSWLDKTDFESWMADDPELKQRIASLRTATDPKTQANLRDSISLRWNIIFNDRVLVPIEELFGTHNHRQNIPEPVVQKLISFAQNVIPNMGLADRNNNGSPIPGKQTDYGAQTISRIVHLFSMSGTDTPSVQQFYKSLLPKWGDNHQWDGNYSYFNVETLGLAIESLGENGRDFIPFLQEKLNEEKQLKLKREMSLKTTPPPDMTGETQIRQWQYTIENYIKAADKNIERYLYIIDSIERGKPSGKYRFFASNKWQYKYAQQDRVASFTLIGGNLEWNSGFHSDVLQKKYKLPGDIASVLRHYLPRGAAVHDIEDGFIVEASPELRPYAEEIGNQLDINPMRIGFDNVHYEVYKDPQWATDNIEGYLAYEDSRAENILNFIKAYLPNIYNHPTIAKYVEYINIAGDPNNVSASRRWSYKYAETLNTKKFAGIPIDDRGFRGELVPTPEGANYFTIFEYQWASGFTDINLQALNFLQEGGLLYPSPSYIAINGPSSWNPVDPVDQHFLNAILTGLKQFAHPKWSEGKNPFLDVLNKATGKNYTDNPDEVNMTEIEETEVLPLPKGITFGQNQTIDVIGPYPGSVPSYIDTIIRMFENAAKPLIDNNTLDYYRISSKLRGDRTVMSQRGQQEQDEYVSNENRQIGYWKYIVSVSLNSYPHCKKSIEWINRNYPNIQPSNTPVNLRDSQTITRMVENAGYIPTQINIAMLNADGKRLSELENTLQMAEQYGIQPESLLYHLEQTDLESLPIYMSPSWASAKYQQFMINAGYETQAQVIMKSAIDEATRAIMSDSPSEIKRWSEVINELNLSPELIGMYDQKSQQYTEQDKQIKLKREEQRRLSSFNFVWDRAIIDLTSAPHVVDISNYDSLGEYLVDKHEYSDSALQEAYDAAQENAMEHVEQRPSETYGENDQEIQDDIEYESDDFLEDIDFWSTEEGGVIENHLQSKEHKDQMAYLADLVSTRMRDKFIEWKINKMRGKEDQDSWKYEPEASNEDIYEALPDIAEREAYEAGIMYLSTDRHIPDWMEVHVHPKFAEQAKNALKIFAQQNKPSDNWDDPGLPKHFEIDVTFFGTNKGYKTTVYDLLHRSASSNLWEYNFIKNASKWIHKYTTSDWPMNQIFDNIIWAFKAYDGPHGQYELFSQIRGNTLYLYNKQKDTVAAVGVHLTFYNNQKERLACDLQTLTKKSGRIRKEFREFPADRYKLVPQQIVDIIYSMTDGFDGGDDDDPVYTPDFSPSETLSPVLTENKSTWRAVYAQKYQSPSEQKLRSLIPLIIKAAQEQYNQWDASDPENGDPDVGFGGICQDIADQIATVINTNTSFEVSTISASCGEQHVWAVVNTPDGIYEVDIPASCYETGGGYNWQKIPGVEFSACDIVIHRLGDSDEWDQYTEGSSKKTYKQAAKMPIDQTINHITKAIINYIPGDWKTVRAARLMPSFRLQKYGVVEMMGSNVKAAGDMYYVKVFYEVRKRQGHIEHPSWDDSVNNQKADEVDDVQFYDSTLGHRLLSFRGFIEGWKGPNGPQHNTEERAFPIDQSDPRGNMVHIASFGESFDEEAATEDSPFAINLVEQNTTDTPFAVAEFVRNSIDKFWESGWGNDGGGNEDEPIEPTPSPQSIKSPVMSPVLSQGGWIYKYTGLDEDKWQGIEWPVRQGTGDDINELDSPPQMAGGDYVLYHGTSLPVAQKIVNERRLTADDWGCVGVCTTHRGASIYGSMKAKRLPDGTRIPSAVIQVTVDGNWLRQQELTREGGGSGHDQWLIRSDSGPAEIPPEAIKDIRIWTISGERVDNQHTASIQENIMFNDSVWDERMQNEWMSVLDIIDDDDNTVEASWQYDFVTAAYNRFKKPYTGPPRYFGPPRLIRFMGRPTIVGNTMSIRTNLPNFGFRWDGNVKIEATQLSDAQGGVINGAMIGTRELNPEEIDALAKMGVDMSMQAIEFQPWTPQAPQPTPSNPDVPVETTGQAPVQQGAQDNQANIQMIMKLRDAATTAEKGEVVEQQVQKLIGLLTNPHLTAEQAKLKEQFLKFMSTAHSYSFFNTVLIFMQNSSATMVGGAKNFWATKGRQLTEGSQPIWILAPQIRPKIVNRVEYARMAADLRKDGVPEDQIKDKIKKILGRRGQLLGFKDVPVYDVSQTQPIPGWTDENGNPPFDVNEFHQSYRHKMNTPSEYADALFYATSQAAAKMNIKVSADNTGTAGGYSSGGNIVLDKESIGERRVAVMFHEFAHEVLHQGEENRKKRQEEKTEKKHIELEAEGTAYLLCGAFDIQGDPEWAARYIFLWDNKPEDVMNRQQNIHHAYKVIFNAVKDSLDEILKSQKQAWNYNYTKLGWKYQFDPLIAEINF